MTRSFHLSLLVLALCTVLTLGGLMGCTDALMARQEISPASSVLPAGFWQIRAAAEAETEERGNPTAAENAYEETPASAGAAQYDVGDAPEELSYLAPFREQRREAPLHGKIQIRRY